MPSQVTPFHSSKPPAITVRSYLEDRCAPPFAARDGWAWLTVSASCVPEHYLGCEPGAFVQSWLGRRILKYAGCSEETFILALIYIDQVVQFNPDFIINSLNVHRLLITRCAGRTVPFLTAERACCVQQLVLRSTPHAALALYKKAETVPASSLEAYRTSRHAEP
jgi:hypothetical protein